MCDFLGLLYIYSAPIFLNHATCLNMILLVCIVFCFVLLMSCSLSGATFSLTLSHQHSNPEAVVQEVQR